MRKVVLNPNKKIVICPKCGNNTQFNAHSQQVAEDCCNVWVECECGYDPTTNSDDRYEDVWGGTSNGNIRMALQVWNDAIHEQEEHT